MVRDVYSGDEGSIDAAESNAVGCIARFRITADVDPGTLPRIAQQLAYSNVMPIEFHSRVMDSDYAEVRAVLANVSLETCDYIRRKLAQLSVVREVTVVTRDAQETGG